MARKIKSQFEADMLLAIVTLGWGVSYFMMDLCLEEMDPMTLNAYRFLGAFAVAAILAFPKIKGVNKTTLVYAFLVSIAMVFTYIGATYGVKYTSQSNAGFFCGTAVIFTPILTFFIKKIVPDKKLFLVLILCTIGMALMAFDEQLHVARGDWLCLMCGFCYTFAILITETGVARDDVDAFQLGVFELGFTGGWMLILALLLEDMVLPQSMGCWISVAFLSVFCTGIAYIAQAVAQQYTSATHVGVIFTLEPVFAAIVAFFFAGERLLPRAYFGAVLMLLSLLIMEVDIKSLRKRRDT